MTLEVLEMPTSQGQAWLMVGKEAGCSHRPDWVLVDCFDFQR